MKAISYSTIDLGVDSSRVSPNAIEVVQRLQKAGFDGYLVGGCVRDLMLDRHPKDFDVTTNANPEQIKSLFDRSKIIGRRFKIVHVHYGRGRDREIIEVATYRAKPKPANRQNRYGRPNTSQSGRILDDNVYGSIDDDVIRRDFTINALYYDPLNGEVLDFVGGIEDIQQRRIKVIGDVDDRFAEDPVRMLRVIRFQGKLDLQVTLQISDSIQRNANLLADVPAARLFDEILKLFHHAAARPTWILLRKTPILRYLFPETLNWIEGEAGHDFEKFILSALTNTDKRVGQNKPVIPAFLFSVLIWWPFLQEFGYFTSRGRRYADAFLMASDNVFRQQLRIISVPMRVRAPAVEIWNLQSALEARNPRSIVKILGNRRFRAAYDFLLLRQNINEVEHSLTDWWTEIQDCTYDQQQKMIQQLPRGNDAEFIEYDVIESFSHPGANQSRPGKRRRRPRKQAS